MTLRFRFLFVFLVLGVSFWFIYPSLNYYYFLSPEQRQISKFSGVQAYEYAHTQAQEQAQELIDRAKIEPNAVLGPRWDFLINLLLEKPGEHSKESLKTVYNVLIAFPNRTELETSIRRHYLTTVNQLKSQSYNILRLGLDLVGGIYSAMRVTFPEDDLITDFEKRELLQQVAQDIRSRLDVFGLTGPQVSIDYNQDRFFLELPGLVDSDSLNNLIRGSGSLSFNLVDTELTQAWRLGDQAVLSMRSDLEVVPYYELDDFGIEQDRLDYVLWKTQTSSGLEGGDISNIRVVRSPITGSPAVSFSFGTQKAEEFFQLTNENVNRSLAIVLGNRVIDVANISVAIPDGHAQISIGNAEQAYNLAKLLRSGSLPLEIEIESVDLIGPSLAKETVDLAIKAAFFGLLAVIVFMLFYYRFAGFLAGIVLLLNLFITLGILSAAGFLLTLTSVAGFILSAGMAVDAAVLIFERMKEEQDHSLGLLSVIQSGFQKSRWTIIDANITTLIASIFLSFFSSGLVKGFAFTLSWSIFVSLFTSLFVLHFFFILCYPLFKKYPSLLFHYKKAESDV